MKLQLSADKKIRTLKKDFEHSFPYLKLEFFKKTPEFREASPRIDLVPDNATLIQVAGIMKEGQIEFKPWQSVAEFQQLFQSRFYLSVQVFRKTKFSWIETTTTDDLSLEKQNRMGRQACGAAYDKVEIL
jgi:hypothetical protein